MGKTDVIAKLCEKNEEFLKTLEKAEQVLKNPNVRGGSTSKQSSKPLNKMEKKTIAVWFSCGAASAVAAKKTLKHTGKLTM